MNKERENEALLNDEEKSKEELSRMGFTDSLEDNIAFADNFISELEKGLKKQDDSVQSLLDDLEKMSSEAKENIKKTQEEKNVIEHAKELKESTFEIYSFCVQTKEKFNNIKQELHTNQDFWNYMTSEFLPAIDKIQKMNGGK